METASFIHILQNLARNQGVFRALLTGLTEDEYRWKPSPNHWNLLEVLCHLHDEEREDFRARVQHILETPDTPFPSIDPGSWVVERKYPEQDFEAKLEQFMEERNESQRFLHHLHHPNWENAVEHPRLGPVTASMMLHNWLAHDYLHIRQIIRLKHAYLQHKSGENLSYAGEW